MKKEIICLPWFFSSFSTTKKSCSFCSESICQLRQPILLTPPECPRREFLLCLPGTSQLCLTDLQPSWQRAEQPAEHLLWGQAWSCIRNRIGPPGVHTPPATRVKRISSVDNDRHEKNTALFSFFFFFNLTDNLLFSSSGDIWSRQIQFQNLNFRREWLVLLFIDVTNSNWFRDDVWPQTCISLHVTDSANLQNN